MGGHDPCFPFIITMCNGIRECAFFEVKKMICDFNKFVTRNRRNPEPLSRFERHKAFRDQLRKCLAQSADTDVVVLCEFGKLELRFGKEKIADNVCPQPGNNVLASR